MPSIIRSPSAVPLGTGTVIVVVFTTETLPEATKDGAAPPVTSPVGKVWNHSLAAGLFACAPSMCHSQSRAVSGLPAAAMILSYCKSRTVCWGVHCIDRCGLESSEKAGQT